jgi:hypothetical protein
MTFGEGLGGGFGASVTDSEAILAVCGLAIVLPGPD